MACETCNTCEGCNFCEGCNRCEWCNICEACNKCQAPECQTKQAFCAIGKEYLRNHIGTFSFSRCHASGQIMGPGYFDKSVWDEICEWISERSTVGDKYPGGSSFRSSYLQDVDPFSAAEFNRVAGELNASTVAADNVIYGSYFSNLESAAARLKINSKACDKCNTDCDADGCDKCLSCNNCNSNCNSGLSSCYDRNAATYCNDTSGNGGR